MRLHFVDRLSVVAFDEAVTSFAINVFKIKTTHFVEQLVVLSKEG
jgi:hypothetical protein